MSNNITADYDFYKMQFKLMNNSLNAAKSDILFINCILTHSEVIAKILLIFALCPCSNYSRSINSANN